jgi:hypothetical protein
LLEVLTCAPFEEEFVGFNGELLEDAVPNEAVFDAAGGKIPGGADVGGDESGIFGRYGEFVVVSVKPVCRAYGVCEVVCLVKLCWM